MNDPKSLTDEELIRRIESLSEKENQFTCALLVHLAELDSRESYLERGYPSLFEYCTRKLCYSEAEAGLRITAARLVRRFPEVLEALSKKSVTLSSVRIIGPVLTRENVLEVLKAVSGRSKRDVELYVTRFQVQSAPPPERIKPIAVVVRPPVQSEAPAVPAKQELEVETKFHVQCTVSKDEMEELNRVRELLSSKFGRVPTIQETLSYLSSEFLKRNDPEKHTERREDRKNRCAFSGRLSENHALSI